MINANSKINKKTKVFIFILIFLFAFPLCSQKLLAQNIFLSITPPLLEAVIQPGKEYRQAYGIINSGSDIVLTPKIFYFTPSDDFGNVEITEIEAPDWIKYNKENLILKNGTRKDFYVLITPPEDTQEGDHFLSLVFENSVSNDSTDQTGVKYQARIASNILLSISKDGNPKKSADIVEFSAPKIVDTFFPSSLNYKVILSNNGNSFWKPNGKIITKNQTLKIAEQNVISGYKRQIRCIKDQELTDCKLSKKPLVGILVSTLEFSIDDNPKIYSKEIKTYILPVTPLLLVTIILTLTRQKLIFKLRLWPKRK